LKKWKLKKRHSTPNNISKAASVGCLFHYPSKFHINAIVAISSMHMMMRRPIIVRHLGPGIIAMDQRAAIRSAYVSLMTEVWMPIESAPFGRDLELAVIDYDGPQALVFPCRRGLYGWVRTEANDHVNVHPTDWRHWDEWSS
jgi:hypothetical protein